MSFLPGSRGLKINIRNISQHRPRGSRKCLQEPNPRGTHYSDLWDGGENCQQVSRNLHHSSREYEDKGNPDLFSYLFSRSKVCWAEITAPSI